jgi:topoisomerase-4 subunit B
MLSVFIREPEFQGQTKDRCHRRSAAHRRAGDQGSVRPLAGGNPLQADKLLDFVIERADERLRRRAGKGSLAQDRGAQAAPAGQARRLHQRAPKAPNCSSSRATRAGGSAKQARDRAQAILPLRGKILNVASATQGQAAPTSSSPT